MLQPFRDLDGQIVQVLFLVRFAHGAWLDIWHIFPDNRHDTVEGMLSFSGKEGMETWRMKSFI